MSHFLTLPHHYEGCIANLPASLCWPPFQVTSLLARMSALVTRMTIILGWPRADRAVVRIARVNQPASLIQNLSPESGRPSSGSDFVIQGSAAVGLEEILQFSVKRDSQPGLFCFAPTCQA
ncbi:MAG: hypothetical protein EHM12_10385 [Dehalococcoidia bacterium]|nr:MAG: hypothetical protein EHM12_10385 [Dehalococcoidia bacterium]